MSGKKSAIPILFLALTLTIFFGDVLSGSRVLITANMARWLPWRTEASPSAIAEPSFRDDSAITYFPRRWLSRESLRDGHAGLWNPHVLAGTPHLADFQSGVFHPLNLLLSRFDPLWSTGFFLYAHLLAGACGLFLFLRALGVGPFGGTIGATAFAFNAYFATYLGHPVHVTTGCWLPFLLLAVRRAVRGRGWLPLPAVVAMLFLGGFPQTVLYSLVIAGAYALFEALRSPPGRAGGATGRVFGLAAAGAGVALGIGLVLFQVLPTRELATLSDRTVIPLEKIVSLHQPEPVTLLRALVPDFFGNPVDETYWIHTVDGPIPHPNDVGFLGYAGVAALALATVAVVRSKRRERWFFLAVAAVSVTLLFSSHAYALYYKVASLARFSSELHRLQFPFLFALSILAGLGWSALFERSDDEPATGMKRSRAGVVMIAAALALVIVFGIGANAIHAAASESYRATLRDHLTAGDGLRFPFGGTIQMPPVAASWFASIGAADVPPDAWKRHTWNSVLRTAALLALLGLAFEAATRAHARSAHVRDMRARNPHDTRGRGTRFLVAACAVVAVHVFDTATFARTYYTNSQRETAFAPHPALAKLATLPGRVARLGGQYLLPSNTALVFGIDDIGGVNALMPARYGAIFRAVSPALFPDGRRVTPFANVAEIDRPVWDLLGMRSLLVGPSADPDDVVAALNHSGERFVVRDRYPSHLPMNAWSVLDNRRAMPLAFLIHDFEIETDIDRARARLVSQDFDPRGPLLLESDPGFAGSAPAWDAADRCDWERNGATLRVRTDSKRDGLLFVCENDMPGWTARIDDAPAPILRAHTTFRAVAVPAGEHEVVMRYEPASWRRGVLLSGAAGALYLLLIAVSLFRKKRD